MAATPSTPAATPSAEPGGAGTVSAHATALAENITATPLNTIATRPYFFIVRLQGGRCAAVTTPERADGAPMTPFRGENVDPSRSCDGSGAWRAPTVTR